MRGGNLTHADVDNLGAKVTQLIAAYEAEKTASNRLKNALLKCLPYLPCDDNHEVTAQAHKAIAKATGAA